MFDACTRHQCLIMLYLGSLYVWSEPYLECAFLVFVFAVYFVFAGLNICVNNVRFLGLVHGAAGVHGAFGDGKRLRRGQGRTTFLVDYGAEEIEQAQHADWSEERLHAGLRWLLWRS